MILVALTGALRQNPSDNTTLDVFIRFYPKNHKMMSLFLLYSIRLSQVIAEN